MCLMNIFVAVKSPKFQTDCKDDGSIIHVILVNEDKNNPICSKNIRDPGYICKSSIKKIKIILIASLLYHKPMVLVDVSNAEAILRKESAGKS